MSIEYNDSSLSELMPLPEALEKFKELAELGQAKSLHTFTSSVAYDAFKKRKTIEQEIEELKGKIAECFAIKETLLSDSPIKSATATEIKLYGIVKK